MEDLVDSAHLAAQTVEGLADEIPRAVVAVLAVEVVADIDVRFVATRLEDRDHGRNIFLHTHVVAWVLVGSEPGQDGDIIGEVQRAELNDERIMRFLQLPQVRSRFRSRSLAFRRREVSLKAFLALRAIVGDDGVHRRIPVGRDGDLVEVAFSGLVAAIDGVDERLGGRIDIVAPRVEKIDLHWNVSE